MSFDVAIRIERGAFARDIEFASSARVTALVGPSGGGKTSTLLAVAGLVRPVAGHVRVDDRVLFDAGRGIAVPVAARGLGVVFQDGRLFPHMSVRGNLRYSRRADDAAVVAMAGRLGIASLLERWPRHLSGGEAQRVALGRALLARPSALLLDEPLAHLDSARAEALLALIGSISAEIPLLYVTHDLREAEHLGAEIVEI